MKYFSFIFFFIFSVVSAQETTWFDAEWNETSEEKATFYRPKPAKIKKGYWVIDYYKNGTVKREGYAKHPKKKRAGFDGLVIEYYTNGKKALEINYKDGTESGLFKEFYDTGELRKQTRYRKGKPHGTWKEFHKNGKIKTKGRYKDGEKVGVWKTYYKNDYSLFLDY